MRRLSSFWFLWAGLNGALSVAMAAYAAHGLSGAGDYVVGLMDKATLQQGLHATALTATAALSVWKPSRLLHAAAALFSVGMLLFCGTLYGLIFAVLPTTALAPVGGSSLILGWIILGVAGARLACRTAPSPG
ncbi:DUF423 domain-containing protein [Novispirillum itersonii]|uniref:Uncharacterized membrane protein YgdD (TMEM256/DUF423 family) n=1 Tax=Novispirillum itersonii TaxID=189 RepID=A0A7W9ZHK5_NOVIT|nr:DUF423 domain-containing protein [Novispirillum itersonii]MBB6210234.1 uncharacterized membrane protein YgdD (TMEM256/DUF423 family) [Novispirillum itersonii]